ncbi:Ig-like domain-containing protein [Candidatus Bathyarchaeota archaeon]|nr:Ig-like domain-containing protein [Candidatus Bathyarchaeota archaeon]
MKRNKTIRIVTFLTLALFALSLLSTGVQPARAYTFSRSVNVALVPGPGCIHGGTLYTSTVAANWPDGVAFSFTNVAPATIADGSAGNPLTAYDTVMLMSTNFDFDDYWSDSDTTFKSRITNFVAGGGKLIIYVSETYYYPDAFANFIVPFTMVNPGQTGSSGGTLINIADDTLSSSDTADIYPNGLQSYIDLPAIVSQTDAVGDLTVMTNPVDPSWYIDMTGINVYGDGGPAHAYAFYGDGLIIYNGLDIDDAGSSEAPNNSNGDHAIQMVWWRELCGQTLEAGQSVSGLTLSPATATNPVDTTHTVTASVKDIINDPVPGVLVTFNILTGPNAGATGTATTDANGEATFSWSSSTDGIDTVQASITDDAGALITTTATKTWYVAPTNVIPEVPLGTAAITATMLIGLAAFYAKRRTKTPKL